jgi:ribosomal protein S18 acetylase RimI-like enzyme
MDIERAGARAVPAVENVAVEGWTVSIGRGAVNRMNSVTTFGVVPWDMFEAVEAVERRYRARRRAVMFRLTEADEELDDLLYARGYERSAEVVVMARPATDQRLSPDVKVTRAATPTFVDDLSRLGGYSELRASEIGESLGALTLPYAVLRIGPDAIGVGVVDRNLVGLFDIAVAPEHRRDGLGRRITEALIGWGHAEGAGRAYLQVHSQNQPAIALYLSLGFEETHRYWYRTRD